LNTRPRRLFENEAERENARRAEARETHLDDFLTPCRFSLGSRRGGSSSMFI